MPHTLESAVAWLQGLGYTCVRAFACTPSCGSLTPTDPPCTPSTSSPSMTCIASPAHVGGTHASLCTGATSWASGQTTLLTLTLSACTTGGIQPCTSGRAARTAADGSWNRHGEFDCDENNGVFLGHVSAKRRLARVQPGVSTTAAFNSDAALCLGTDPADKVHVVAPRAGANRAWMACTWWPPSFGPLASCCWAQCP